MGHDQWYYYHKNNFQALSQFKSDGMEKRSMDKQEVWKHMAVALLATVLPLCYYLNKKDLVYNDPLALRL